MTLPTQMTLLSQNSTVSKTLLSQNTMQHTVSIHGHVLYTDAYIDAYNEGYIVTDTDPDQETNTAKDMDTELTWTGTGTRTQLCVCYGIQS